MLVGAPHRAHGSQRVVLVLSCIIPTRHIPAAAKFARLPVAGIAVTGEHPRAIG